MTDDELRASLKRWAHSTINAGADLEQLRTSLLCVAAAFWQAENSDAFAARARLVHSLLPAAS
jgi:hypothetical protein